MKEYQQERLKGKFIVEWQPAQSIEEPRFRYNGFQPGTTVLPKGWQKAEGMLPLPCDIVYDRDVAITLRDGTVIYADVFRPVTEDKVPVLFASTMFGKYGSYVTIDDIPGRNGIPEGALSGLQLPGQRRQLRYYRVPGHAALEQRQGGHGRQLLACHNPVVCGLSESAASGGDSALGGPCQYV